VADFINKGDDIVITITLRKQGSTFLIDSDATVKVSFMDGDTSVIPVQTVLEVTDGSDWLNSLLILEIDSATTSLFSVGDKLKVDVLVDDPVSGGGRTTWKAIGEIQIVQGFVE
jgi:hypothetical protein